MWLAAALLQISVALLHQRCVLGRPPKLGRSVMLLVGYVRPCFAETAASRAWRLLLKCTAFSAAIMLHVKVIAG